MSNTTPQPCRIVGEGEPAWRVDSEANRINRLFNSGSKAGSFPTAFQSKHPVDLSGSLIRRLRRSSK